MVRRLKVMMRTKRRRMSRNKKCGTREEKRVLIE